MEPAFCIRAGEWLDWVEKTHPDCYEQALAAFRQAHEVNPEPRYQPEIDRLLLVEGEAWAQPPPVEQQNPVWIPGSSSPV